MNRVINMLLVEDDNLDAIDLQRTLDRMGIIYKIKIAKNGEEAIHLLTETTHEIFSGMPDIILLDINMPRMNGIEFLQTIRSHEEMRQIKVFVLTTSDQDDDKVTMRRFGISGYITKPFKGGNTNSIDAFNLMIDLLNFRN